MPDRITYLGWDSPPVQLLQEWLINHFNEDSLLDLSRVTIVLPSASAIRQLQQGLIQSAKSSGTSFLPPDMTTVGGLPEKLYPHNRPADPTFQQLAWYKAIRNICLEGKLSTFLPQAPHQSNNRAWNQLADAVARVHRELSGDGISFANIVSFYENERLGHEVKRWKDLERVQNAYFTILDQNQVWDLQKARLIAIENSEISAPSGQRFIVAGCSDLTNTLREFLASISAQTEFIVFAPQSMRDRFDSVGCLISDAWNAHIPSIPIEQIKIAGDPNHQAELVLDTITTLPITTTSADILIATPDSSDEKTIVRQLAAHDIMFNVPTGPCLVETKIPVLLRLIGDYVATQSFQSLASLLRHPDVASCLISDLDITRVLTELTEYHEECLPLDGSEIRSSQNQYPELAEATKQIRKWFGPILSSGEDGRDIHIALLSMLDTIYGDLTLHRDEHRAEIKSLSSITQVSTELGKACKQLDLKLAAGDFLSHVLSVLAQSHVPAASVPDAVSISGWLDTPWSPHRNIIVTGLNEGIVPTTSNTDLFIDDQTRHALGLLTNQRRLARDAYALTLLQNSRDLTVICKKNNSQGDPLPISRLLLHGAVEQQADLIKRFSSGQTTVGLHQVKRCGTKNTLPALEIQLAPYPAESISVTDLRRFLTCPLRYYLGAVLGLSKTDDSSRELSPLAFGNLIHNVLYRFGTSDIKESSDESEIGTFLENTATKLFRSRYGRETYPAAKLQLQQAYHRLWAFAKWQANWRAEGWTIVEAEYSPSEPVIILEDYPDCKIRGRIDRIDYNVNNSTYAIFDYKTGESSDTPEKVHRSSQSPGWADLQLPMYRHLCGDLTADSRIILGYITLGKDLSSIGHQMANWDEHTLQDADKVAVEVIQAIRKGDFSDANPNVNPLFDEYSDLLGLTTLDHTGFTTTQMPL